MQFSNKDRNKYKCINLNEKCNQLWLSSIAYNSIRKKIITLAYFNGSQSRKKTYHHILVVPKDSINFAVRIKTSYSKGTVFEMINKGLYYEIKRAGIPINMINNKKYEDPRLEEEINKQKDMHDEEGYKQLFKIKETRKRGYYK